MPSTGIANPNTSPRPYAAPFPVIVTILGPPSRAEQIARLAHMEEMDGRIPVVPHVQTSSLPTAPALRDYYQARLDELTRRKIDMADEVLLACAEVEITKSLGELVDYATSLRKPVRRWLPESVA